MASYSLCMLTTYMVQPNGIVVHAPDACLHFVVGLFNIYNFFSTPFCVPPPPLLIQILTYTKCVKVGRSGNES